MYVSPGTLKNSFILSAVPSNLFSNKYCVAIFCIVGLSFDTPDGSKLFESTNCCCASGNSPDMGYVSGAALGSNERLITFLITIAAPCLTTLGSLLYGPRVVLTAPSRISSTVWSSNSLTMESASPR